MRSLRQRVGSTGQWDGGAAVGRGVTAVDVAVGVAGGSPAGREDTLWAAVSGAGLVPDETTWHVRRRTGSWRYD